MTEALFWAIWCGLIAWFSYGAGYRRAIRKCTKDLNGSMRTIEP